MLYNIYTSVACAVGPSVTTSSTDFSFQHLVFLGIYLNFQGAEKSFKIFKKLLHHKSKTSWNQAHGWMDGSLLLVKELFKDTKNKQDLKHRGGGSVDLITSKQNKLPSFIDRCMYVCVCVCVCTRTHVYYYIRTF